jgi:hypothetical protein
MESRNVSTVRATVNFASEEAGATLLSKKQFSHVRGLLIESEATGLTSEVQSIIRVQGSRGGERIICAWTHHIYIVHMN